MVSRAAARKTTKGKNVLSFHNKHIKNLFFRRLEGIKSFCVLLSFDSGSIQSYIKTTQHENLELPLVRVNEETLKVRNVTQLRLQD